MMRVMMAVGILMLGACAGPTPEQQDKAAADAVAAAPRAARGLPVNDIKERHPLANSFPPAMQGRWGLVAADCDVSRGDTKGLLTIGPDTLKFYESTGTITAIEAPSRYKVRAKLDFEGEGQKWQKVTTLELVMADTHLVRTETDPAETFRYEHC